MRRTAFSLVELSIVLVILGLLVGGILAGQSLIRAAELRSVTTEYTRYVTALHSFRDKYFALPGDIANATAIWGSLGGTGSDATCQNIVATGLPTCNGNGNGSVATNVVAGDEQSRFWQHLVNAGLMEGRYTGVHVNPAVPGSSRPGAKVDSTSVWNFATLSSSAGAADTFAYPSGHRLTLGDVNGDPFLRPAEAWNIDTKMDDGLPGKGMVTTYKNSTGNCTTTTNTAPPGDANSAYALSYNSIECSALYWQGML